MPPERDTELLEAAYGPGRTSAPRTVIAETAAALEGAFSVEELGTAVHDTDSSIATATVYRAVATMTDTGFLEHVGEREGSALYARCDARKHHHHLVCIGCGAIAEAPCPLEACAPAVETSGFLVTGHEVRLYGLCPACAPGGAAKPESRG